jgi:hypothetical protein
MNLPRGMILPVAFVVLAVTSQPVSAARVRYHYVPPPGADNGPVEAVVTGTGERLTMFGGVAGPAAAPPPKATCRVTYRHPSTGRLVTVPLALPDATPRIEHRFGRLIYNYGSDTVEVLFQPDGSVDVVYNTGLFRGP